MHRKVGFTALALSLLLPAMLLAKGVTKTSFTSDGLFITGSSKITGNGSTFTVCDYFDAGTGAFLGQVEDPSSGFSDEASLQAFCLANAPAQ